MKVFLVPLMLLFLCACGSGGGSSSASSPAPTPGPGNGPRQDVYKFVITGVNQCDGNCALDGVSSFVSSGMDADKGLPTTRTEFFSGSVKWGETYEYTITAFTLGNIAVMKNSDVGSITIELFKNGVPVHLLNTGQIIAGPTQFSGTGATWPDSDQQLQ